MANQFFFEERQIKDIIIALLFLTGDFTLKDENDEDIFNRCKTLAAKLHKQYGRELDLENILHSKMVNGVFPTSKE